MRYFPFFKTVFALSLAIFLLLSCNDQGELGETIVDPVRFGSFKDDLPFKIRTVSQDSIVSFLCRSFFVGRTDDPIFGEFKSSFYTEMSIIPFDTTFSDYVVDSVYLQLLYDTIWYGDTTSPFDIYVHRLLESPDLQSDFWSNSTFSVSPEPIGSLEGFRPQLTETLVEDTIATEVRGRLRIPLDRAIGEELLSYDSAAYASNITFQDQFKGIYVRSGDNNQSMLAFDMANSQISGFYTALIVYFTSNGVQDSLQLLISSGADYRLAKYENNQEGALVNDYLGDYQQGEELAFLSGHSGNALEIELQEAADFLDGFIVNHAEICLPLNESINYNYDIYPPLNSLNPIYEQDNGDIFRILDFIASYFDSDLKADNTNMYRQYCLNITSQLQKTIQKEVPSKIIVLPTDINQGNCNIQTPYKAVVNGSSSATNPAKLKVYYTQPE